MSNYFKASGANRLSIVLAVMVLAFAALVAWFAYDRSSRGGYVVAAVLAIVAFLIPQAIMVADQWERAVVLRLGKLSAIRGPGLFVIVPFIDEVASWLDQRIQTTQINAEKALSKDTVPVNIDAVIFWQIHDPERAALRLRTTGRPLPRSRKLRSAKWSDRRYSRRCYPNASRAISSCARKSATRLRNGACRSFRSKSGISACRPPCRTR